jgi:hypothetical protein
MEEEIPGVTRIEEEGGMSCVIDDSCFEPPPSYTVLGK